MSELSSNPVSLRIKCFLYLCFKAFYFLKIVYLCMAFFMCCEFWFIETRRKRQARVTCSHTNVHGCNVLSIQHAPECGRTQSYKSLGHFCISQQDTRAIALIRITIFRCVACGNNITTINTFQYSKIYPNCKASGLLLRTALHLLVYLCSKVETLQYQYPSNLKRLRPPKAVE